MVYYKYVPVTILYNILMILYTGRLFITQHLYIIIFGNNMVIANRHWRKYACFTFYFVGITLYYE